MSCDVKRYGASGLVASQPVPAGNIEVKMSGAFQEVLLVSRQRLVDSGRFFIGERGGLPRVD